MSIDKKILSEIERHRSINKYIMEQEVPPPPPPPPGGEVPAPEGAVPPPPPGGAPAPVAEPEPIDVEADDEVEKIDDKGKSEEGEDTEELEITDLVTSQENIEKKQDEYFNNLFSQLSNLESKLSEMDKIVTKLNSLESKIEKYRDKTPQEKLELRSYDSYPFNQKLSDFFTDKQSDMEKTGKNEYILTTDDVTDISDAEIKNTFLPQDDKEQM
jgi:type IV secretory pathway VirB10-like protein